MSKFIQNQEKNFKNFSILPGELRAMVIGDMPIDDRCRFSGSSMLSNLEAKASKNYVDSLEFESYSNERIEIQVKHTQSQLSGYTLEFADSFGPKYMEYSTSQYGTRFRSLLDPSTNVFEKACEHFKELLKRYQRYIRRLTFFTDEAILDNMEITRMDNLEELTVWGNFNYQQLLLKAKNPLKSLAVYDNHQVELPIHKIYAVQDELVMPDQGFNSDQFAQLSAKTIVIHIGDLTEQDVYDILRSWQSGKIGREVAHFNWNLDGSDFSVPKLFRLLGHFLRFSRVDLPHYEQIGKSAQLQSLPTMLTVNFDN